eukprot:6784233-Alexandrium_andersonii.AAC.1
MRAGACRCRLSSRGGRAPWTPREAPPARLPARFVVTVGFGVQNDTEPHRRGRLGRWNLKLVSTSEWGLGLMIAY